MLQKKIYLKLKLTSTNKNILFLFLDFLHTKLELKNKIFFPKNIKKFTVIKAAHIHKKSREQFEIRYYKQLLFLQFFSITDFYKFRYLILTSIPANIAIIFLYTESYK